MKQFLVILIILIPVDLYAFRSPLMDDDMTLHNYVSVQRENDPSLGMAPASQLRKPWEFDGLVPMEETPYPPPIPPYPPLPPFPPPTPPTPPLPPDPIDIYVVWCGCHDAPDIPNRCDTGGVNIKVDEDCSKNYPTADFVVRPYGKNAQLTSVSIDAGPSWACYTENYRVGSNKVTVHCTCLNYGGDCGTVCVEGVARCDDTVFSWEAPPRFCWGNEALGKKFPTFRYDAGFFYPGLGRWACYRDVPPKLPVPDYWIPQNSFPCPWDFMPGIPVIYSDNCKNLDFEDQSWVRTASKCVTCEGGNLKYMAYLIAEYINVTDIECCTITRCGVQAQIQMTVYDCYGRVVCSMIRDTCTAIPPNKYSFFCTSPDYGNKWVRPTLGCMGEPVDIRTPGAIAAGCDPPVEEYCE